MADSRFHHNKGPFTVGDIAALIGCDIAANDKKVALNDVAPLDKAGQGHLTFLDNAKYKTQLPDTKATACILAPKMVEHAPEGLICLVTDKPYKAYAKAAQYFYGIERNSETTIHPSAIIAENAQIGAGVLIEAGSIIGDNVIIGDQCHIGSHVTISHSIIGQAVRIHNGVRIGQDGFGFAIDETGCLPVPQLGRVLIEDHVNIGANTCIDRGSGPDTVIGAGSIIDNLVQIGHNVRIGKGCIIVSQVGIAGSTRIEDYCVLGGQVGVAGHLNVGKGSQIAAQSGVSFDVPAGSKLMGYPAKPIRDFWREVSYLKKRLSKR